MTTAPQPASAAYEGPSRAFVIGVGAAAVSALALVAGLVMVTGQAVERGQAMREVTATATAHGFHCRTLRSARERQDCLAQPPPTLP